MAVQFRHTIPACVAIAALLIGSLAASGDSEPANTVPAKETATAKVADSTKEKPAKEASPPTAEGKGAKPGDSRFVPDPKQTGGEPDGVVQVANLVYAGTKSSHCFSDHFLIKAEQETAISTSRRFHAVKLDSAEIYDFPLLIMTGEGTFQLADSERENLRRYIERGGFLLASAGCSSEEWDRSFRSEMAKIFVDQPLDKLKMDHPVFHTITDIKSIEVKHGEPRPLEGISIGSRLGVLYSQDGLNDTSHTQGCCCCGGNEIRNCVEINTNVLAYALTY